MLTHPSPNYSSRDGHAVSIIVVHGDAGSTEQGTLSWLAQREARASYHYLVGRDGTVYSIVREGDKAWHAGRSHWHGREVGTSVNPISIGVCFANNATEPYRDEQMRAGGELIADIMARYRIPPSDVRGHYEVSPGRKTDPWDHFPWGQLFAEIGRSR